MSSRTIEERVAAVARDSTQAERDRVLGHLAAAAITSGPLVDAIRSGAAAPPRTADRTDGSDDEIVAPQSGVFTVQLDSPRW